MGTIFEQLLRRFNEENNVTEAGEHFTPRDIVDLMADIAFVPVVDKITDSTYLIYDGACGTGGIEYVSSKYKDKINGSRLRFAYDGVDDYCVIPDIGDPQMLFLANNISKMKQNTELGSRIVEVHNGSSLFTGDRGWQVRRRCLLDGSELIRDF